MCVVGKELYFTGDKEDGKGRNRVWGEGRGAAGLSSSKHSFIRKSQENRGKTRGDPAHSRHSSNLVRKSQREQGSQGAI